MADTTIDYRPTKGDLRFGRSKSSNQPDILLGQDGRSITSRRFRDVVRGLVADAGGREHIPESKMVLLRQLAAVCVIAEMQHARALAGERVDLEQISTLALTALRLRRDLEASKVLKKTEPTYSDYVRASEDAA
jgi:hypothetical protein